MPSPPRQRLGALGARCQILFEHGHPSEAEAALRALIDCQPEDASAYHNLGILMLRSKRHDEAARRSGRRCGIAPTSRRRISILALP